MRPHRSSVLSVMGATSFTLVAVACGGNPSESMNPTGPSAVGGAAFSVGGAVAGGGSGLSGGPGLEVGQAREVNQV